MYKEKFSVKAHALVLRDNETLNPLSLVHFTDLYELLTK